MCKTANILGINFKDRTKKEVRESISNALSENKRLIIFTPNPQFALAVQKNTELRDIVNSADILIPDGIGIIIASRILSTPLTERITGVDMGESILEYANQNALRVFLLGGRESASLKASQNISKRFPKLVLCGAHHGYFDKQSNENNDVIKKIKTASPDIVFVCFGFPEQEKWIYNNKNSLPDVKLFAGLGGSIDIWAGDIRRAPRAFQRLGLEWLWRVLRQPSRLRIFSDIPAFLICVLKQKYSMKTAKKTLFYQKRE